MAAANPDHSPLASYFAGAARSDPASGHPSDFGVFRNWFAFQVPQLDSPLTSATLTLPNPNRYGGSFSITIYGMTSQPQAFADINPATLTAWGTVTTTPASFGQKVVLNFNAAGVSALWNAQGNTVYFGGIDSGESQGLYNADFSNTGEYDTGVDIPVHSILTLNTTANVNATCSTPAPGFSSFQFEHPVSFSGQAWIRERLTYDNATKILVTDLYTVPVGTAFPTPSSIDIVGTRFGYLVSYITNVYLSCSRRPSAFLTGVALDGANLYGIPDDSGYALGFGFTTDNPAVIRDIGYDLRGHRHQLRRSRDRHAELPHRLRRHQRRPADLRQHPSDQPHHQQRGVDRRPLHHLPVEYERARLGVPAGKLSLDARTDRRAPRRLHRNPDRDERVRPDRDQQRHDPTRQVVPFADPGPSPRAGPFL